jgi:flagellar basal-body rod protein FlgB
MLTDLRVFSALKTKMQWHETRQGLLAENIAHANTPNYRARDLKEPVLGTSTPVQKSGVLVASRTNPAHFAGPVIGTDSAFDVERVKTFEITPEANSVVLEEEMMKMTANQLDYQAVTTLYQKSMGLLKTALGRR